MAPRCRNGTSEHVELLLGPADSDAEDEPAPAELIDVGPCPRDLQWTPVRQDGNRRADLHRLRGRGKPAHRRQRLVERRGIPGADVGGDGDVVGAHDEVVAHRLDEVDRAGHGLGVGSGSEVDEVHAYFHFLLPFCSWSGSTVGAPLVGALSMMTNTATTRCGEPPHA